MQIPQIYVCLPDVAFYKPHEPPLFVYVSLVIGAYILEFTLKENDAPLPHFHSVSINGGHHFSKMRAVWFLFGALVTFFGIRFWDVSPLERIILKDIFYSLRRELHACRADLAQEKDEHRVAIQGLVTMSEELQDCKSLLVAERLLVDQLNLESLTIRVNQTVNSLHTETRRVRRYLNAFKTSVFDLLEECPVD